MKQFTSQSQKIGKLGEDIAEKYLRSKGFLIIERNYTKKWGEIDLVAKKLKKLHFIEVKTIQDNGLFAPKPTENIHEKKLARLYRAAETYLVDRKIEEKMEWQIDALAIILDLEAKTAKVSYFENI